MVKFILIEFFGFICLFKCLYFLGFWFLQTETLQYSGSYASMGVDNSLRLDSFRENFRIKVIALDKDKMEFDMIGVDAAVANAFRRILISEVCTLCLVLGIIFL